ncbi:hypothetical protein [Hymenobacter volaticus]|uniref:Uncharacterized protein n=1 Tax=Hymenobacter volaticus TaxID=2932254 RepID=A0ABY4GEQ0_9BACT|nr:hypothetical protein [Hymenobacter volaticus]UOQ69323.1 hypothetical protein MUN86_26875 [Hymenobacter volaticus]
MPLDIYWQEGQAREWLGSLPIDTPLEELLYAFSQTAGIPVDPYGGISRLYRSQWQKLIELAEKQGYPTAKLQAIQTAVQASKTDGLLVLFGD